MAAGVLLDFVLGILLSNITYYGVLSLRVPTEATLFCSTDDLTVVVVAKHLDEVKMYAIHDIKAWKDDCCPY